ncbi:hypothetical protein RUMCAL_03077 [Ruminococcus callidus ATCC 27760]|uniref:Uncharacterized protein n=1 Tax=Ruminococcus callidus ATCC 27760 TaxID=411473 RepID=U2LGU7_9FIRM|nr:hypothetical protein RUMCAL_03077 [Ruminococcus callidus ATCC 27760]
MPRQSAVATPALPRRFQKFFIAPSSFLVTEFITQPAAAVLHKTAAEFHRTIIHPFRKFVNSHKTVSGKVFWTGHFSVVELTRQIEGVIIIKKTLHKARLTALHAICVQIFRHIAQKSLARHQVCLRNFWAICQKI